MICSWLLRTSWKKRDKSSIDSFLCCVGKGAELLKGMKRGFHNLPHSVQPHRLFVAMDWAASKSHRPLGCGCYRWSIGDSPSSCSLSKSRYAVLWLRERQICLSPEKLLLPEFQELNEKSIIKLGRSCVSCLAMVDPGSFMATAPSAPSFTDLWPLWIEAESPLLKMAQHWG